MKLVIVESPAKAKTINKYLGSDYKVLASFGHIRDLPSKDGSVNPDDGFAMTWELSAGGKKRLNDIIAALKDCDTIVLASDPDREGEAIAWHILEELTARKKIKDKKIERVVFHEITKSAVTEAIKNPRQIDDNLVSAYMARRALDYLVGFTLSPVLWRKLPGSKSAGRVQSVALRLICDRENEIEKFKPEEYWTVDVDLITKTQALIRSHLITLDGKKLEKFDLNTEAKAMDAKAKIEAQEFHVSNVERKKANRYPAPPFTTSTLQQEAARKLRFSAKKTMQVAQKLYEDGFITYMRTDAVNLSQEAIAACREVIVRYFGEAYLPKTAKEYKTKSKNAQEAHEAIRPAHVSDTPKKLEVKLDSDAHKLYELIWKRTVACQMKAAVYDVTTLLIGAAGYQLRAGGAVLKFDGFLKLSDKKELAGEKEKEVPYLPEQTPLKLHKLMPAEQHFTEPPPHFTEATLVKELEEKGIGRPSTYSPTIQTILDRGYIVKDGKKLVSTELGELIVNMLTTYFKDIINIPFTANLETELDEIAEHEANKETVLENFYEPFSHLLQKADKEIETVEAPVEVSDVKCEKCGRMMVYKQGRYGKFLACPGFPECRNTKPILKKIGVKCPDCGGDIIERKTKTRKVFYGCSNYPECKFTSWDKPTEQHCPKCGHILYEKTDRNGNKKLFCTNENCEDAVKTYKGKAAANAKSK